MERHILKEALNNINPVSPPDEIIENLNSLSEKYNLSKDSFHELVIKFYEYNNLDLERPSIAILRSGYHILFEYDIDNTIDNLVNSIIGESIQAAMDDTNSWKEFFNKTSLFRKKEIEHLRESMHDLTVRTLFSHLLYKEIKRKRMKILKEAFPNLRTDTEEVYEVVKNTKAGMVLLLGKDTDEGLERLNEIKEIIERNGLNPILIKEQPDHISQGLISKVLLHSLISRYIIIENTFLSGHLAEIPYVIKSGSVIIVLQEEGKGATRVLDDMIPKEGLVKRFRYKKEKLKNTILEVMEWAEKRIEKNNDINKNAWPWYED